MPYKRREAYVFHKAVSESRSSALAKTPGSNDATLKEFTEDPYAPALRNHPLHGKLKGWRSISAGGNLRILFECDDAYDVGTHTKVY